VNSRGTASAERPWRALTRTLGLAALCLSFAVVPVNAGQQAYIDGVDVSRWQGKPRWADAKVAGVRFVIAKATEGTSWVDPEYARNRSRLRAVGIPFSAYHFAGPDTTPGDAIAEADHFVNTARLDRNNLLPVLDLERHYDMSPADLRAWTAAWLGRVQERLGVKPMIYTTPAFWVERMGNTTWFADNGYPLWIAHWTAATQPTVPGVNWGGRGWTLWQHAVVGGLDGIIGKVDRDRYAGTTLGPLKIKNNR